MSLTVQQELQAFNMAEAWAKDPERLFELLGNEMTDEQWMRICVAIAKQITAIGDEKTTHEQCLRDLMVQADEISGVIIELLFLPITTELIKLAEREGIEEAAERRGEDMREEDWAAA